MDNDDIEITLDNENENIDVNEENYVYINIPESVIEEMEQQILLRALITETGSQIALQLDTETYKLKTILKDKNGNVIYTSNEIDLPLESVVIDGEYDSVNKKLILTLENGNTIEITLEDLISGLVNEDTFNETIEELESEITELKEENEQLISQIPTETVSGESIDITDSSDLPFEKFEIEGNSTQETTTGAQLLNITRTGSLTTNGITFTLNSDKSVTINGTATASADYNLISANDSNNTMKLPAGTYTKAILDVNKQEIQGIGLHCRLNNSAGSDVFSGTRFGTATLSEETEIFVRIRVFSGYTFNNKTFYPMIISGEYTLETVPDYEIYTGGMASPSPDYPQPIYNAGDNGSITEIVAGKNYFNFSNTVKETSNAWNSYLIQAIKLEIGKYYTAHLKYTKKYYQDNEWKSAWGYGSIIGIQRNTIISSPQTTTNIYDKADNILKNESSNVDVKTTFLATAEYLLIFGCAVNYKQRFTIAECSLNKSDTNTEDIEYVPYSQQNISIPCQQPMRSTGEVKDKFVKVSGAWYERHNINSIVLTGEEEVTKGTNAKRIIISTFSQLNYCTNSGTRYTAQCSHENSIRSAASTESNSGMGFYNSKIWWNNDYFENMTAEQAQTFLTTEYQAGHPVTVNHIPPTPTDLPCTAEQIEVLESLPQVHSERTTTHIFSIDDVPATVNATYRKDLTTMFNKLDTLENRVELLED